MLLNLHVKNLALIKEAEVDFGQGLNILTGETGAGKSLIIGSVNMALGGKTPKDMVRDEDKAALVELLFSVEKDSQMEALCALGIPMEEDRSILMQRKIQNGRSTARINGETVTASVLKKVSELLIDIHGQHEHQSLLYKKNHLTILDSYGEEELAPALKELKECFEKYQQLKRELEKTDLDENERNREISLLTFEIDEIENAALTTGEDETLENEYRKMVNSKKITEAMNLVYQETGYESGSGAGEAVGRALRELNAVVSFDEALSGLSEQLLDIDSLLNDFNRSVSEYMSDCEFSEEEFRSTEERLNTVNHLKSKYGNTIEKILAYKAEKEEVLEKLEDYDKCREEMRLELQETEQKLSSLCERVSGLRVKYAKELSELLKQALFDLNFLEVEFEVSVEPQLGKYTQKGFDDVEFLLSTNPGEKVKPLSQVASGGELSRIMLALKTVLAKKDAIDTLIFDEIDTGISGRTAQKVAEKLSELSKEHQVICITHLPQIAAQASHHFLIRKGCEQGETLTDVKELSTDESVEELARMLGGAKITEAVLLNAKEMKDLAN